MDRTPSRSHGSGRLHEINPFLNPFQFFLADVGMWFSRHYLEDLVPFLRRPFFGKKAIEAVALAAFLEKGFLHLLVADFHLDSVTLGAFLHEGGHFFFVEFHELLFFLRLGMGRRDQRKEKGSQSQHACE